MREWGLEIKEYPTTRAQGDPSLDNIKLRAKDIHDAFTDNEVKAIFTSIGGDDCVRILPFLDKEIIINNPKVIMGYSDTTILLNYFNTLGLVTFNGPTIMAGFSQMDALPESFKQHVYDVLFNPSNNYEYPAYGTYCDGYADWSSKENIGKTSMLKTDEGLRVVRGSGIIEGVLYGGCIEVMEFVKGTKFYPPQDFWNNKILFFETSEEKPSMDSIKWMLRNYGVQGIFEKVNGILFGRARDYTDEEKIELDNTIKEVICVEFNCKELPIITNFEFGHTDPQVVMPNGVVMEINLDTKKIVLPEPCVK